MNSEAKEYIVALEGHPAGLPQLTLDSILHRTGEMVSHGQREQNCIALELNPSRSSAYYSILGN